MEQAKEDLESNLNRISALADALWAASLGDNKAMEPKTVKELADMIKDLADNSLAALDGAQA
jgi:hypothetical protein